jgi:23S rRNA (uracil1939-C5)-methyltransferase
MKNREHEVTVDALAPSGDGVVHVEGRDLHLADALPGERVRVAVERGSAVLRALVEPSPERVTPRCEVFDRCGGCAWQHASDSLQRTARLALLRRALPADLREVPVTWHASPSSWGWRTRARLAWESRGSVVSLGFRARRARDVVATLACPVLDARLEAALRPLHARLGAVSRRGEVSLALGDRGAPVASVYPDGTLAPGAYAACAELVAEGFAGVALWVPGASVPAVTGDPRPRVEGPDGAPLVLGVDGFAQANASLNASLAETVVRLAPTAGRRVLELHAGAGNFTVMLARQALSVTAVESDRDAASAMRENLAARALTNVSVRAEPAERCVDAKADVVVLDPPRTGAREVVEALAKRTDLRAIVYVSCDPATLGRDLTTLRTRFEVTAIEAFEMFPQTAHVETVVLLTRGGASGSKGARVVGSRPQDPR